MTSDQPTLGSAEAILGAVAHAAERFLAAPSWRSAIDDVLARLGEAAGVSRVYVFETSKEEGVLYIGQTAEWAAPGIQAQIHNPDLARIPVVERGFGAWTERLARGDIVIEALSRAQGSARELLAGQQIQTFVLVPISSGSEPRGLIGFDDCLQEREWQPPFIEALRAAAGVLGAAMAREDTERELRETEERFRTLVERMPTVTHISRLDRAASTVYMSPQVEEMLGYPLQRWYDEPDLWLKILHPDDRGAAVAANERHISTGEPLNMDYRMITADGRTVWVRDQSDVVRAEDGTPLTSQGILLDITARKEAEEELQRSLQLLKKASEDRRRLFADLSRAQEQARAQIAVDIHDDPLQKVTAVGLRLGVLQQRLAGTELAPEVEKLETLISAAATSLRGMLFDMYPMQLERYGLSETLRDLLERASGEDGLKWDLEDALPQRASPEVESICFRIAHEAISNTRAHADANSVKVRVGEEANGVRVTVADDGRGFDPESVPPDPGHLGLASMRERAELAGGWMKVKSATGRGTKVDFWIPDPE